MYDVPTPRVHSQLVLVQDNEAHRESPVETKHLRLARKHRNSPLDRDLKPNTAARNDLTVRSPLPGEAARARP